MNTPQREPDFTGFNLAAMLQRARTFARGHHHHRHPPITFTPPHPTALAKRRAKAKRAKRARRLNRRR